MGKILARYQVTVTLRAPEPAGRHPRLAGDRPEVPTNDELVGLFEDALHSKFDWAFAAKATSERTDRAAKATSERTDR